MANSNINYVSDVLAVYVDMCMCSWQYYFCGNLLILNPELQST